jgi:Glycosyl transferase family 2
VPERDGVSARDVALAVPCRTDEPALARTLEQAWASWQQGPAATRSLVLVVCLNGEPGNGRALRDLRAFAAAHDVDTSLIDADADAGAPLVGDGPLRVVALATRRAGKAIAWNLLRSRIGTSTILFMDADVSFAPPAIGLLLDALDASPGAVLASARTNCAGRDGWFERVMAVPYAVDFPNLSPQLYTARRDQLPAVMPENLLDPERWLELTVGAQRIVRAAGARVMVRLPATLRDFFWQRVRIEMGKVQLATEHPGLLGRGTEQPGISDVVRQLGPADLVRLGVYLVLRHAVHAVARRWYARGRLADVWRQPASTKRWDRA